MARELKEKRDVARMDREQALRAHAEKMQAMKATRLRRVLALLRWKCRKEKS